MALPDFLAAQKSILPQGQGRGKGARGGGGGAGGGAGIRWAEIPWTLAAWARRQVGFGTGDGDGEDQLPSSQHPLVVVANVDAAAQAFHRRLESEADGGGDYASRVQRTFTQAMFRKRFEDVLGSGERQRLSPTDMDVLLKYLARDKGEIVYDARAIRIIAPGENGVRGVTEEDASIASLRELLEYLGHQAELLSKRVEEMGAKAKEAVAKKNRVAALAALRSKKLAESSLETRLATRSRLEEVADRIEQAADQVALVKVMESSADVLKNLNAQVGGAERVEDIVERLRDQVGQVDEVQSILAEPGILGGDVVDESKIDEELVAMEQEEKQKREEAEREVREEEERKQAEETRERLERLEKLKPLPERTKAPDAEAGSEEKQMPQALGQKVAVTTEGMRRLSLEEQPQVAI
jgi:charged multivesicular body protein 7